MEASKTIQENMHAWHDGYITGLQSSPSGVERNREDNYKLHQQEDLRRTNTLDPSDLHNTEGNL